MQIRFMQKLSFKLGVLVFALEAAVFALLGTFGARWVQNRIDGQLRERIALPGRMIGAGVLEVEAVAERELLGPLIGEQWAKPLDGCIVNDRGDILVSSQAAWKGANAFALRKLDPAWLNTGYADQVVVPSGNRRFLICITPISIPFRDLSKRFAVIEVDAGPAENLKRISAILFAAGSCIGMLLTTLPILFIFRMKFVNRIFSLVSVLKRVEKGDLNARADEALQQDEIGQIQQYINTIVAQLQETIQILEMRLFDLKESERERERIQTQFFHAQKMEALGTLTGSVAHDFNNLLTAIQGCADMALLNMDKNTPVYRDLKEILASAQQASDLTRQLLLFSRKQPMTFESLKLNCIIEDLYKLLHRLIGEDIGISTPIELDLWTIQADKGCMAQMIINLACNARDAMMQGGLLTLRAENVDLDEASCRDIPGSRPGRFVRLTVTDTGVGMAPEVLGRIFEPFFTTKQQGKGSGLGLAVVYGIVEQHDGFIHVSSRVEQGSVFEIYLPAVLDDQEGKADAVHPDLKSLQGRHEKILIVEDETGVREYLESALIRNGYEVLTAASAVSALDLFENHKRRFDLVFCDVVLPDRNGVELVEDMIERKPGIAVLLSSGYTDRRPWLTVIEQKKYPYLQKPYRMIHLLKTLRDVIQGGVRG